MTDSPDGTPPVRILERREAAENSKWSVYLDHIRAENGHEVHDYLVVQPKVRGADNVAGVGVLPVMDGKLILLKTYRYPTDRYFWEIPRGFLDAGEGPEASARRELAEEAGLSCGPGDLKFLCNVASETSTFDSIGALYVAENCRPSGRRDTEEPGLGERHAFDAGDVRRMLAANEIIEAHTQVALGRYLLGLYAAG